MYTHAMKRADKVVTRAIHGLFLSATRQDASNAIATLLTRVPALILYNIFIPLQIAYGIQAVIDRDFASVPGHAWIILALATGYAALWSAGGIAICRNGIVGSKYIQREIFKNFLGKDYEFYAGNLSGALGAQAMQLRNAYSEYSQIFFLYLPNHLVTIVAGMAVIAFNSIPLALITLAAMAAVLSFTIAMSSWRLRFRRRLSDANSELAGAISDSLSHGTTVKSFASEEIEQKHLEKPLAEWAVTQYKSWTSSIPTDSGRMILAAIAISILLLATSALYKDNSISIAVVALVQLYVIRMIAATEALANLVKQYEACMGSAYTSVKTMLIKPALGDPELPKKLPAKNAGILFDRVSYRYPGTKPGDDAVRNFTLRIAPGEKIGLVGYSGSGKTTLTKLLMRFMDVTEGAISLSGISINDVRQHDIRSRIAYVPQEPLLFCRSVADNIAYGRPGANHQDMLAAAQTAHVDEFANSLPKGYETLVGEHGVKLSGGQRQRVAIARALLKDAEILVLDEATSALDSRSEKYIQDALWRLMKDKTALVVAHRLSTIQHMDKIVVMNKGRIVQTGTHQKLLKEEKGIYAKLWAHQSGGYVGVPTPADN
jgi:ATP-binding cassette, subfamily B, bacterial